MWKYLMITGVAVLLIGCGSSSNDGDDMGGMDPPPDMQNDVVDLAQQILGDDPFGQPRDLNGIEFTDSGKSADLP